MSDATEQAAPPVNYLDALAGDIGKLVPDCPPELLRLYALLALVKGEDVTLENVHDAWAAWRAATKPDHPSLIPFGQLAPEVQELDAPYRDAIRAGAQRIDTDHAPLPDGFYGRVELPGYRDDTGWITEESRFGTQAAVVRDWDGREVGIYFIGPACRIVALPTPLKRPEPEGPRAITGSAWPADDDSGWDDDAEAGGPF